jgi:hypothetical protein
MNNNEIEKYNVMADDNDWKKIFRKLPIYNLHYIRDSNHHKANENLIARCCYEISRREVKSKNLNLICTIIAALASVFGVMIMLLDK